MTPVNWAQILDDLNKAGVTRYRISVMVGKQWHTVNAWRHREPKYSDGQLLLTLWTQHCQQTTTQAVSQAIQQTTQISMRYPFNPKLA